jgi:hypothetical protein
MVEGVMDMHQLNAYHWGVSRQRAKTIAMGWVYSSEGINDLNATFLDICHPEVRVQFLAIRGIILGEN